MSGRLLRNLDEFRNFPPTVLKTLERNGVKTIEDFLKTKPNFILYVFASSNEPSDQHFKSVYQVQEFKKRLVSTWAPPLVSGDVAVDTFRKSVTATGVEGLDQVLGGSGLRPCLIYEVYGACGVGKTQLCMFLAVTVASQGQSVLYLDTKNDFSPQRVNEMARAAASASHSDGHPSKRVKRSAEDVDDLAYQAMSRIRVARAHTLESLLDVLYTVRDLDGFGLLVIDNFASVLTPVLDQSNFGKIAAQIRAVKARVQRVIHTSNMAAVVVNNAVKASQNGPSTGPSGPSAGQLVKPALGKLFNEFADVRISVRHSSGTGQPKNRRLFEIEKNISVPSSSAAATDRSSTAAQNSNCVELQLGQWGYKM